MTAGPQESLPEQSGSRAPDAAPSDLSGLVADAVERAVHLHLREHLAHLGDAVTEALGDAERTIARRPSWLRPTAGEPRWAVAYTVLAAIGLQFVIPAHLALHPVWLLPGLELVLLVLLVVANPRRIVRDHPTLRVASIGLVAVASIANAWSALQLVRGLVQGTETEPAGQLLIVGGGIWLTNVIIFALWYWEFDRGGPVARSRGTDAYPDFLFPQMQSPDVAHDTWAPTFVDYLYLSFTNAMAFSPTDTLPLDRWAKMMMLAQSMVSLLTVALIVARAVNVLG